MKAFFVHHGEAGLVESRVVYGDESGNSGADFFDKAQPVFVFSFLSWPLSREAEVLRAYEAVCSLHGRTPPHLLPPESKAASEWKSERLLGRHSGRVFCESLLRMIQDLEVGCLFGIAEKRFVLTGMLVETFLDPEYNSRAPAQWDAETRKKIAAGVYGVFDDDVLKKFSNAVKDDDVVQVGEIGRLVASRISLHRDPEVAVWGRAIEYGASNHFRFGEKHDDSPKRAERPHPGVHTLFAALIYLDRWLGKKGAEAELVIDEEAPFNDVKMFAFELLSRENPFLEEIGVGHIGNVRSLGFVNSKKSFGVQLADVLAGVVMRGCRDWMWGEPDFLREPVYQRAAEIFRSVEEFSFVSAQNGQAVVGWTKRPSLDGK